MGFLEEAEMATVTRSRTLREYVEVLEEERRKMVVFHRELPYSLDLVSRALESYRLQLEVAEEEKGGEEEEGPVLKEFIPTKGEESKESKEEEEGEKDEAEEDRSWKLPEWLRVAKAADPRRESHSPTPPIEEEKAAKTVAAPEAQKASMPSSTEEVAGGGGGEGGRGSGGGEDKGGQRKARRCWSPELHHRFLQALQQLGGSHVATPKQIRDLMKVDGLTNDEVKSHLQKYRLHTRRGSPPAQPSNSSSNVQTSQPQIVFIGSMWAPPSGPFDPSALPAGAARTEHPPNRVYAPIATIPLKQQQQQQNKRQKVLTRVEEQSVDGGGSNSDSSATTTTTTSSHTVTTTESPLN